MLWCEAMFLVVVVVEVGGGDAGWGWRVMQKRLNPFANARHSCTNP